MNNPIRLSYYKNLFAIVLFLLAAFKSNAQNTASISGNIENPAATSVQLVLDSLYLGKNIHTQESILNNGHFQFTILLSEMRTVELVADNHRFKIFVEPGIDLKLNIKDTLITFTGAGAEQNNFLSSFYNNFKKEYDDSLVQQEMLNKGVDAFEIALFDSRKKQKDFFNNHADKAKFSIAFNNYMQNIIAYNYWYRLLSFPITNASVSAKILTVNTIPKIMFDDFDKVKVSNDDAMNADTYRKFLKYYIVYFTSERNGFKKFTDLSLSADKKSALAKEKLTGIAYKYWLSQFLVDECGKLTPNATKKLFADLTAADKQNAYTKAVNTVCGERMKMKEEPMPAAKSDKSSGESATAKKDDFHFTDLKGKQVSLSDFKGKVVYIDFWASWCGPCRKMMPLSKQLHAQLSEKQKKKIVFLYVSIDADLASWKKGINDLGVEGVNVISPGNWQSKACAYFQLNSIPRYMIMDKKGEIVDHNAPRPSDQSVMNKLLKLADE